MDEKREIEPRSDLDQLVERVEHGEVVKLTREGKTVARIVPENEQLPPLTWQELTAFRKSLHLKQDMPIKDMINDGRKR